MDSNTKYGIFTTRGSTELRNRNKMKHKNRVARCVTKKSQQKTNPLKA